MSNLSLYNLNKEYQELFFQLYDSETGEVNEEIQARLNALEPSIEKKCVAIASFIKKMEADKQEILNLKEQLKIREMNYDRRIDKLENYLIENMEQLSIKDISCPFFSIKLKKNPHSVEIGNEDLIPEKFKSIRKIVKTEVKVDKKAIKEEFLKTGIIIPGAFVSQKTRLDITTNI